MQISNAKMTQRSVMAKTLGPPLPAGSLRLMEAKKKEKIALKWTMHAIIDHLIANLDIRFTQYLHKHWILSINGLLRESLSRGTPVDYVRKICIIFSGRNNNNSVNRYPGKGWSPPGAVSCILTHQLGIFLIHPFLGKENVLIVDRFRFQCLEFYRK